MLYKPLWYSIAFLLIGFSYFLYGPVYYRIENNYELVSYFLFYIFMGCFGYILGVYFSLRLRIVKSKSVFRFNFWFVLSFSLFSNLTFNYVVASGEWFPTNIVNFLHAVLSGDFISLANLYYDAKLARSDGDGGGFFISVVYAVLGWARFIFLPYVIWNWSIFSSLQKVASLFVVSLPVLTGLSIGLNKPVFDFVIVFFFFTLVAYIIRKKSGNKLEYLRLKKLIINSIVLVFLAVAMFGYSMNNRGVDFKYIEYNSPKGDILVKDYVPETGVSVGVIMLGHYMIQGYYGLSLSMEQDFDSTLGVGHSPFISRQFSRLTGQDVSSFTYQQKIDSVWPDGLRWHSAFAQFANDVHFIGVGFYIFFIFFMIALSWVFSYKYEIRELLYFMPMHAILVIFLPANNQVFGFPESMVLSFLVFLLLIYRLTSSRRFN